MLKNQADTIMLTFHEKLIGGPSFHLGSIFWLLWSIPQLSAIFKSTGWSNECRVKQVWHYYANFSQEFEWCPWFFSRSIYNRDSYFSSWKWRVAQRKWTVLLWPSGKYFILFGRCWASVLPIFSTPTQRWAIFFSFPFLKNSMCARCAPTFWQCAKNRK